MWRVTLKGSLTVLALCFARGLAAQNPVPVQLLIAPWNGSAFDLTPRLEFSTGHTVEFLVTNVGSTGGPDAKVQFSCTTIGSGMAVTSCPAITFIEPGGGSTVVAVTVTMGGAGGGALLLTATAILPGPTGST